MGWGSRAVQIQNVGQLAEPSGNKSLPRALVAANNWITAKQAVGNLPRQGSKYDEQSGFITRIIQQIGDVDICPTHAIIQKATIKRKATGTENHTSKSRKRIIPQQKINRIRAKINHLKLRFAFKFGQRLASVISSVHLFKKEKY